MPLSRRAQQPGRIGAYWLSRRPNSRAWCRTWYDARTHQTRRESLGTDDFDEAQIRLAEFHLLTHRPRDAHPRDVLLVVVLRGYFDRHACNRPSASHAAMTIQRFAGFWDGITVGELTPSEQGRYVAWRRSAGVSDSTIDRELAVLRAAIRDAAKAGELAMAPHIRSLETAEMIRSRAPKGRPLTLEEMAALFNAAKDERARLLLLILANTLCRPDAARDLTVFQYDRRARLIDLNPPGRRQTKKHRPVVPVTRTLQPWLALRKQGHYLGWRGKRVASVKTMWRKLRRDAGLWARDERGEIRRDGEGLPLPDLSVNPYSIRHTMARELRRRRVPTEQIQLMLGHKVAGLGVTATYAPYDPDYCRQAAKAIDAYFRVLTPRLKRMLLPERTAGAGRQRTRKGEVGVRGRAEPARVRGPRRGTGGLSAIALKRN